MHTPLPTNGQFRNVQRGFYCEASQMKIWAFFGVWGVGNWRWLILQSCPIPFLDSPLFGEPVKIGSNPKKRQF